MYGGDGILGALVMFLIIGILFGACCVKGCELIDDHVDVSVDFK